MAFVSPSNKMRWFANEAEVNLAIKKRMRSTTAGKSPLLYFDGATMQTYQYASRSDEVVYCRTVPNAYGCSQTHGIDPKIKEIPSASLVLNANNDEGAGLGIFTKVDVPEGSYLAMKEQTKDIFIPPSTYELIYNFSQHPIGYEHSFFSAFLNGYGCENQFFVSRGFGGNPLS